MPYKGGNDPNLPSNVKKLPPNSRKRWVAVWNSVYKRCISKGGSPKTCEGEAFKQANGVVKK